MILPSIIIFYWLLRLALKQTFVKKNGSPFMDCRIKILNSLLHKPKCVWLYFQNIKKR